MPHFTAKEMTARRRAAADQLIAAGLAGILLFKQESMYYLSGYDSFGFCFFQCMYFGADGRYALLTRAPDLRQAEQTSDIKDIRIWVDREGATPMQDLRAMLDDYAAAGAQLGCEYNAYGLSAAHGKLLDAELAGFCQLVDASDMIDQLRTVKSDAEIVYVKEAAKLADAAFDAARNTAHAGAYEGDILAAMQGAVFQGGGDYAGNEFIIGSGARALLCRYASGRAHLRADDQLTLEYAGVYRRYHACLMQTFLCGQISREHKNMHAACADAMQACIAEVAPGKNMGGVFDAHAKVLDAAGFRAHRLNACGYSLGASFTPCWMDYPMFFSGNRFVMRANMIFFIHIILMNSDSGRAMTLGQTVRVTESGAEKLSGRDTELVAA